MDKVFKVLKFFRITDENNLLSLTHIALFIGMYKIATTDATNLNDVGLFLVPLLNYAHKRVVNKDK